ncbi:hypothetical protein EON81_18430 [bacterium]|nr:MAG: hypothetical protein EON81_18430 [bacterium]
MIPLLLSLQATSPGTDPRLDVPTQLAIVMEPVASALAPLGKAKGCSLEVAAAIGDRKVGLHTENEPLGKTLDQLAEVLDSKWTPTQTGWRLDPIAERMNELASFKQVRNAALRDAAQKQLETHLAIVKKMTFPEYLAETQRLEQAARDAKKEDERRQLQEARWKLLYLDLMEYLTTYTYGTLSKAEKERFWNGEVFYATSAAFPGGRAVPEGASNWKDAYDTDDQPSKGDIRIFIRFDPLHRQMLSRMDRDGSSSRRLPSLSPFGVEEAMNEHPFVKRQTAWIQAVPFEARAEEAVKRLPEAGKGRWFGGYWSVAEVLARFHTRTGLPVVAMVGRKPWAVTDPDHDGKRYYWDQSGPEAKRGTLGAALLSLRSMGGQITQEKGGYLLVRPDDWFDRLDFEPPEGPVQAFEKLQKPTLDDYAVLATRLTPRQVFLLGRSTSGVFRHLPFPFGDGVSMLRLWGSLSSQQRALVRKGGSIPYASMSGPARGAFEAAVLDGIMDGANIGESAKRSFDGPWDGSLFQGLSLWGKTEGVSATGRSLPSPDDPSKEASWSGTGHDSPGIRFSLGRSEGDGMVYTLDNLGL